MIDSTSYVGPRPRRAASASRGGEQLSSQRPGDSCSSRTVATVAAAALSAALMAGCANMAPSSSAPSSEPAKQTAMAASHAGHGAQRASPSPSPSPAQQAYEKSMMGMHDDMMRGIAHEDPDTAFAAGMLPHHQGAIDMARIELQYGKDPELRRLAQEIIDAQQKEIAQLQRWLKNNAKP